LNEWGKIVQREKLKTTEIRKNIALDFYIIMPNHLHGIIGIDENEDVSGKGTMHRAPTIEQFAKPTSNLIPTIIRGFKSAVTKKINIKRNTPEASVWQRN
jgi:REP element-mobilizing transposase RayT